jgi:hypothetical protein
MPKQVLYQPFSIGYDTFKDFSVDDYIKAAKDYLSTPHKGG